MAVSGPAPYKFYPICARKTVVDAAGTTYLVGNASGGITLPGGKGGQIHGMSVHCSVSNDTSGTSIIVTAYKDQVNAANQILQVTIPLAGTGDESGTTTTVVDAGMDIFAADSELIVEVVAAGTTFQVDDLNVVIDAVVAY